MCTQVHAILEACICQARVEAYVLRSQLLVLAHLCAAGILLDLITEVLQAASKPGLGSDVAFTPCIVAKHCGCLCKEVCLLRLCVLKLCVPALPCQGH